MTPSATGTLAATPLAHALVYARNRRLTGRLELTTGDGREAAISIWRGSITSVGTVPISMCPGGFFGAIAYELGHIDTQMLDATLLEISKTKRLHGEVLIERNAITIAQRDEVLVEQIHRKVHHLFSVPDTTTYAFYDAKVPPLEPAVAVDLVGPVWRGIRDYPPKKVLEETLRRVGDNALRVVTGGSARLPPTESALVQALSASSMTLAEMKTRTELPPARVDLLVYLLVISKCVEAVSGARTHPSTGALPTSMPSGPIRPPSAETRRMSAEMVSPSRYPSTESMPGVMKTPAAAFAPMRMPTPAVPFSPMGLPTGAAPFLPRVPPTSSAKFAAVVPPRSPGSSAKFPAQPGQRPPQTDTLVAAKTPAELGLEGVYHRAETIESEGYFDVLGVPEGAPAEAVRAAYIRLTKAWHPDRLVADFMPVRDAVTKIFTHMTRAQKTLCDSDARRVYIAARTSSTTARPRPEVMRDVEIALTKRDFDSVMGLCQSLIDNNADDAEAQAIQIWASIRAGEGVTEEDLRAALTKMDKAVNLDRSNEQAVYHRGLIHKRLGNVPSAFRDFARAVQLNPRHVGAEREVRILAMRVRKGSGEHKLIAPILDKLNDKK